MDLKKLAIAAIEHSIFCDFEGLDEYWDSADDYFQSCFYCTIKDAEEALGCKFDFGNAWKSEDEEDEDEDEDEDGDEDYIPSSTNGDYSPSNPWDAPGMSVKDFI